MLETKHKGKPQVWHMSHDAACVMQYYYIHNRVEGEGGHILAPTIYKNTNSLGTDDATSIMCQL